MSEEKTNTAWLGKKKVGDFTSTIWGANGFSKIPRGYMLVHMGQFGGFPPVQVKYCCHTQNSHCKLAASWWRMTPPRWYGMVW